MKYEDAQNSVLTYLGSDIGRDLDEDQVEQLTRKLTYTVRNNGPIVPEAVAVHVDQLFPEREEDENMHRTSAAPVKQKQSRDEITKTLSDFFNKGLWSLVAPGCPPPITQDAKIGSKINHAAFFAQVNGMIARGDLIRADYLSEIVVNLFQRGLLEKYPEPSQVIEPPTPPTAREIAQKQYALDRILNQRDTSPIRGAKEKAALISPKVTLTEEQKTAQNEKAARDNSIIQDAISRINTFTGASHSRTYSGRAALRETFQTAMDEGKTAEEVLAAVESKADQLAGNSSIR